MLVTKHCNFSNFICAVSRETLNILCLFCTQMWVIGCSYKLWFTSLSVSIFLYCMLFLSLCHPFMLLPQPLLHIANTHKNGNCSVHQRWCSPHAAHVGDNVHTHFVPSSMTAWLILVSFFTGFTSY